MPLQDNRLWLVRPHVNTVYIINVHISRIYNRRYHRRNKVTVSDLKVSALSYLVISFQNRISSISCDVTVMRCGDMKLYLYMHLVLVDYAVNMIATLYGRQISKSL